MTAATVTEGFQTSLIVDEKEDEKEEEKEQEKRNGKMSRHFTPPAIRRLVSLRRRGRLLLAAHWFYKSKKLAIASNCEQYGYNPRSPDNFQL
jgi:hypothetical protein